ncbi:MAG: hypothetical protein HOL37_04935 [Rhodospirillaceae bacterium]|jgi:uncharacterized protein|nr:hypothetical protein [Rhodospirillaceae bacterium]MBT4218664.1 hypothetical protein [Rhodospirillaceae bacterium]MBT5308662.1 hypothetical protein [Rhodospirillaceae bacterium]MBT7357132.1 hypothetical protein [Rhodospirillaceae bacterium]
MPLLKITAGSVTVQIETLQTETADAILDALPITASVNTWGDEVYFGTPVSTGLEAGARDVLETGEIAFWPPGNAIAICFGPTPVSHGDEMRLASPGNIWARALEDLSPFRQVRDGDLVSVELCS